MRTIRLFGFAIVGAAIGCNGGSTTTPQPTPAPAPSGPSSSGQPGSPSASMIFDALMAEAQGHVAIEGNVTQENIVADQAGKARTQDPHLLNAWGLAFNPTAGFAWVSANGNGTSQVYDDSDPNMTKIPLEVTIPPAAGGMPPSAPTGQVFNRAASSAFMGDLFIFASEDGTITAWQPSDGTTAVTRVDNSTGNAIYKGVAIALPLTAGGRSQLYGADFHNNKIDVWDDQYMPVTTMGFIDPNLPAGFAPFNVYGLGPLVLVTYAKQDADAGDDVKGLGNGFVDLYSAEGLFLQRLISGGQLNSPWGLVFAPDNDKQAIDLAVGNFGDGMINIYNLSLNTTALRIDAVWEGALGNAATGKPLVIDGLWALAFGSGKAGFEADEIYFTAGPNDEANGLFGSLDFTGPRQ
ncbi:MAG TPA: TIGR03118 family protein [Polyangia bacterium]|jgi:uncharacterized protein (TIGR03118 family)